MGSVMGAFIQYQDGYKYQLKADYFHQTPIRPLHNLKSTFIELFTDGILLIRQGCAWDGPSGPTIDTKNFMRGSLVHDALYQLMREGLLDANYYRPVADDLLWEICREDGMSRVRAWWVLKAVQWFGDPYADPANDRKTIWAPREPDPLP